MKTLPFTIQKFVFRDDPALDGMDMGQPYLQDQGQSRGLRPDGRPYSRKELKRVLLLPMDEGKAYQAAVPGYFVMSSAPPNIEKVQESLAAELANAQRGIDAIATHLYDIGRRGETAELVVVVHGYNTSRSSVKDWYRDIFQYLNRHDAVISRRRNQVFVGYRWPSENMAFGIPELGLALRALPPLPRDLLIGGGLCALLLLALRLIPFGGTPLGLGLGLLTTLIFVIGTLMLALVVMRLVVYFRDRYRASNFGVLDLVELLRQIDKTMVGYTAADFFPKAETDADRRHARRQAQNYWQSPRASKVKLSFIGHSMGGFVVTHTVRILSDVFDSRSVDQSPPADVGSVFSLERLILASPDIPVLTIISNRANFLASSLRRFKESYLFSSEGDIALRIASTAANYIAFPSQSQAHGYRLGNVSLVPGSGELAYGLTNLPQLEKHYPQQPSLREAVASDANKILENLFVSFRRFQGGYITLARLFQQRLPEDEAAASEKRVTVADFFTFFDCTDYTDFELSVSHDHRSDAPRGVLTRGAAKKALQTWDYVGLTLDYGCGSRDVHGGYFRGEFSQFLIYRLAFLGFRGYLDAINPNPQVALSLLHVACEQRKIQGFLSPVRYWSDLLGRDQETSQQAVLEAIQDQADASP